MELETIKAQGVPPGRDREEINSSSPSRPFNFLGKTGATVGTTNQSAGGTAQAPPTSTGLIQDATSNLDAGTFSKPQIAFSYP